MSIIFNPKTKIVLPNTETIRLSLHVRFIKNEAFEKRFVPLVLEHATRSVTAKQLCDIFASILKKWEHIEEEQPLYDHLRTLVPAMIDEMAGKNKAVARRAKHLFKPTLEKARRRIRYRIASAKKLEDDLEELIVMPDARKMMRLLTDVCATREMVKKYYPLVISDLAGYTVQAQKVIVPFVVWANQDYFSEKMKVSIKKQLRAFVRVFVKEKAVLDFSMESVQCLTGKK